MRLGVREFERQAVEALFSGLLIFPVDKAIARQAGRYRALYGKSHGVLLPDALIAATAKQRGLVLYSLNSKHYPMADIQVIVPYEKAQ